MNTQPLAPIHRVTLRENLVQRMVAAIFQHQFEAGERLVVQRVAASFHVSATPVREALVELAGLGLVTLTPNCGAVVRPLGLQQLREIYHVRRILETEAIRSACGRMPASTITELRHEFEQLDANRSDDDWTDRCLAADIRLHAVITHHCGNTRLADEIARYNVLFHVGRQVVGNPRRSQELALADHLKILSAVEANDPEAAAQEMSRHISRSVEFLGETMFPNRERPPSLNGKDLASGAEARPEAKTAPKAVKGRISKRKPSSKSAPAPNSSAPAGADS